MDEKELAADMVTAVNWVYAELEDRHETLMCFLEDRAERVMPLWEKCKKLDTHTKKTLFVSHTAMIKRMERQREWEHVPEKIKEFMVLHVVVYYALILNPNGIYRRVKQMVDSKKRA